MSYQKTTWVAREGTNLNKFLKSAETSTSVILVNVPDTITVPGTPFSVDLMNKIEDALESAHAKLDTIPIGNTLSFPIPIPAYYQNLWRIVLLAGQILPLDSEFGALFDLFYCGDALNDTAKAWYKCDVNGNRTPAGTHMRILDKRGLFSRAAGQNSDYKMANDAPYDGKGVGEFGQDATPAVTGLFDIPNMYGGYEGVLNASGVFNSAVIGAANTYAPERGENYTRSRVSFDTRRVFTREANEVSVAAVSEDVYMRY
jgi:hypothetical protein